jgi:hypothetical protein
MGGRLDDPDDLVRLEIGAALGRDIRVIPILVAGAVMPRRHELPEELASLAGRNALFLRHESFRSDVDRLLAGDLADPAPDGHPPSYFRSCRGGAGNGRSVGRR